MWEKYNSLESNNESFCPDRFFNQNHQDQPLSNTTQKYRHGVLLVWLKKVGFHLSKIDLDFSMYIPFILSFGEI